MPKLRMTVTYDYEGDAETEADILLDERNAWMNNGIDVYDVAMIDGGEVLFEILPD